MILMLLDTRSHSWLAAGESVKQAQEALTEATRKHCIQVGILYDSVYWNSVIGDANVIEIHPGMALRDYTVLVRD